MNLANAIKELREDIIGDGYDEEVMKGIAKDNGCAPQLLVRKFTEQYKVAPDQYVEPTNMDAVFLERAKKVAADRAAKFTEQGSVPHGIVFTRPERPDHKYVTVAYGGNHLIAVRVSDCEVRNITFANTRACEHFIEKQGMV